MKPDLRSCFLAPRSVAFVGVPRESGPGTVNPLDNLLDWGYQGKIQIVHPHVREIAGLPAVPKVADLQGEVDLCVIASPRETTPGIISECTQQGIRALVVINQGFGDADARGAELQRALVEAARRGGARILGPNTLGTCNAFEGFTTSFVPFPREESPVGVICQSGTFLVAARDFTGGMGIGVDVGNACDVDLADALLWLGSDPRLRVLAIHAEGIGAGRRLLKAAHAVVPRVPVLALKTGRSAVGARAAASHSGSLTGEDSVVDAALRKAGILRVNGIEDLLDLSRGFVRLPPVTGRRVAVVTFTGGGGILTVDAMETEGLTVAPLSTGTLDGLRELSPPWMPLGNPVDVFPAMMMHGSQKVYAMTLRDAIRDQQVDAILCIVLGLRTPEMSHLDVVEVIRDVSTGTEKPIVVWIYGTHVEEARARLEEHGRAMAVASPERGARLLAQMARYEEWKKRSG